MEKGSISKVTRQVVRTFPEMEGVAPSVRPQPAPEGTIEQYVLTYKGKASLPGGKTLTRIVRVVADIGGHVIRISTSR